MVYHTVTWLVWLCAAAYMALTNSQPLHSAVLILATGLVFTQHSRDHPEAHGWGAFLRLGLSVWLMGLAFNTLSVHVGERVLFTLPHNWPLIGGPITVEALLYGLANGAGLFAILLVFAAFNLGVEMNRLLRWVPAGLYQAGLVASIALAFVPQMVLSLSEIRQAQRVRGHRFRGLRDLLPLVIPLVTTALERSLTLAESMEARGFGGIMRDVDPSRRTLLRVATLLGLLSLLSGLVLRAVAPSSESLGWTLAGAGLALVLAALTVQGRAMKRTHFRREFWQPRDTWVAVASIVSIVVFVWIRQQNPTAVWYYPYPPSSPWPVFHPLLGISIALLAAPAFLWPSGGQDCRGGGPETESQLR
jgi:energy-coupling factor transport system permease protein